MGDATLLREDAPLTFSTVVINEGQSYDPLTSSFAAPVSGIYSFRVSIRHYHQNNYIGDVHILKKDKVICAILSNPNPPEENWGSSLIENWDDSEKYWANSFAAIWNNPQVGNWNDPSVANWDNPPTATWGSPSVRNGDNPPTEDWLEGTCEGVTYLNQGDKVALIRNESLGDVRFVTGKFSGHLLSIDY